MELIVFRMTAAGTLTCSLKFPPINKSKMCYMLRRLPEKIEQKNFRTVNIILLLFTWYVVKMSHA